MPKQIYKVCFWNIKIHLGRSCKLIKFELNQCISLCPETVSFITKISPWVDVKNNTGSLFRPGITIGHIKNYYTYVDTPNETLDVHKNTIFRDRSRYL